MVREASFTSRTGPPPAGNEAAVSPSPLSRVQWADPRSTHGNASETARRERTAGRTATRQEHVRNSAHSAVTTYGQRLDVPFPRAVGWGRGPGSPRVRTRSGPRPSRTRTVPGRCPHPHGQQSRHTDVCPLTVGMRRTTLGLLRFSAGGIFLGARPYACAAGVPGPVTGEDTVRMPRAATVTRLPSVCRGVAHVQGATRTEREARNRSRPRGNQQRRARPAGQRPRGAARSDTAVRQDLGGPVGLQGHGAAGRRAPSHRRGDRRQARPAGPAARDRARGRRPGAGGRAGLSARCGRGGPFRDRAVPA